MNDVETLDKVQKTRKYDLKFFPKVLKGLGKIKSYGDYDDYVRDYIKRPIFLWLIDVILLRPILIWIALVLCLSATTITTPQRLILVAVGISIFWDLVIQFKTNWKVK